jgi:hypothetical protein
MSRMIEGTVSSCAACCANRHQQSAEPLLPHPLPFFPWEKIGAYIFTFNKRDYVLVVDYFSKFPFVVLLADKSASSVISVLKSLFAIYGAPLSLIADNMLFSSQLMREFARNWSFDITTSSPEYPRSNGQVERCIQTFKLLLKKAEESRTDPHIALLNYRAAPLSGSDKSPAQLFLNRQLRTKLPVVVNKLVPTHSKTARGQLIGRQQQQMAYHDRRVHDLPPLKPGDVVRIKQRNELTRGGVTAIHPSPRSYIVDMERGSTLHRNRRQLIATNEARPDTRPSPLPSSTSTAETTATAIPPVGPVVAPPPVPSAMRTTRSGRPVKPRVRFRDNVAS